MTNKPQAWKYEIAGSRMWIDGKPADYRNWVWRVEATEPSPGEHIRNVTPLYSREDLL